MCIDTALDSSARSLITEKAESGGHLSLASFTPPPRPVTGVLARTRCTVIQPRRRSLIVRLELRSPSVMPWDSLIAPLASAATYLPALPSVPIPAKLQQRLVAFLLRRTIGRFVKGGGHSLGDEGRIEADVRNGRVVVRDVEIDDAVSTPLSLVQSSSEGAHPRSSRLTSCSGRPSTRSCPPLPIPTQAPTRRRSASRRAPSRVSRPS